MTGEECPKCGKPVLAGPPVQPPALPPQGALRFQATTQSPSPGIPDSDWREEVRKKLDRHQLRKEGVGEETEGRLRARQAKEKVNREPSSGPESASQEPPTPPRGASSEISRKLFKYRLNQENREKDRRIVTFHQKSEELTKPLIRKPDKPPRHLESGHTRQRPLELVQGKPETTKEPVTSGPVLRPGLPPPSLTANPGFESEREVLLSRVLAGLLDLMMALLGGTLFGFVAAMLIPVDWTSPAVLRVAAVCAFAFWLLNMVFFLFVVRQTPGMMFAELELVAEEPARLSLGRIVRRVLLQLLSTISLVGLLWAVFDRQCRCWHDRLSKTLVEPLAPASGDEQSSSDLRRRLLRPGPPRR